MDTKSGKLTHGVIRFLQIAMFCILFIYCLGWSFPDFRLLQEIAGGLAILIGILLAVLCIARKRYVLLVINLLLAFTVGAHTMLSCLNV